MASVKYDEVDTYLKTKILLCTDWLVDWMEDPAMFTRLNVRKGVNFSL